MDERVRFDVRSGQMILAVYTDSAGLPGTRLGVTNAVTVSSTAGWQTVSLQTPASVRPASIGRSS